MTDDTITVTMTRDEARLVCQMLSGSALQIMREQRPNDDRASALCDIVTRLSIARLGLAETADTDRPISDASRAGWRRFVTRKGDE